MVQIINCKRCGRPFESTGFSSFCMICFEQDENDFRKIKDYLSLHPGASIFEVSINLDLSITKLKRYLREGRLEIIQENNTFLLCKECGKPIRSGKFCDACFRLGNSDFKGIYSGNSTSKSDHKINYVPSRSGR